MSYLIAPGYLLIPTMIFIIYTNEIKINGDTISENIDDDKGDLTIRHSSGFIFVNFNFLIK